MNCYPSRVWLWTATAGLMQPLAMEAYNIAWWYWADPGLARLVSLSGPLVVIGALAVGLDRPGLFLVATAAWAFSWQLVGIETNWAYRIVFLGLQAQMVVMWWLAHCGRSAWVLEYWAKIVGLGAACIGVAFCVLFQFVFVETPFLGTMPVYDPAAETASAMVRATGFPMSVWAMPLVSLAIILALASRDTWRRGHRLRAARPVT